MIFPLSCPKCANTYHADDAHIGRVFECVKCHRLITVERDQRRSAGTSSPRSGTATAQSRQMLRHLKNFAWASMLACLGCLAAWDGIKKIVRSTEPQPEHTEREVAWSGTVNKSAPVSLPDARATESANAPPVIGPNPFKHESSVAPKTGTMISGTKPSGGHGRLEMQNGNADDAVIVLCKSYTSDVCYRAYLRAAETLKLRGIPPGEYDLVFSTGRSWDEREQRFLDGEEYVQFGKSLDFLEKYENNSVRYTDETITLYTVPDGNVKPVPLNRSEYLRLLQRSKAR